MSGKSATNSFQNYSKNLRRGIRPLTPQNRSFLELGLSILTVIFFGWFALRPTLNTIADLLQQIEVRKELVTKIDEKIDSLIAADAIHRNVEPRLPLLKEALPSEHNVSVYSAQVEQIAQENNVTLQRFTYQEFGLSKGTEISNRRRSRSRAEEEPQGDWKSLKFNISASGQYGELRRFIASLYQLRRIVLIDNISFAESRDRNLSGLELRIDGQILFL